MNTPYDITADIPVPPASPTAGAELKNCVRQHPAGTLLFAAGLGLAVVLAARALTPPPPRNRALALLEDIQQHLSNLAKEGRHAVDRGANSLVELHIERSFDKLSRKFKSLFH